MLFCFYFLKWVPANLVPEYFFWFHFCWQCAEKCSLAQGPLANSFAGSRNCFSGSFPHKSQGCAWFKRMRIGQKWKMLPLADGTATAWSGSPALGDLLLFPAGALGSSVSVGSDSAFRELSKSQRVTVTPGNGFHTGLFGFLIEGLGGFGASSASKDVDISIDIFWFYGLVLSFHCYLLQIYRKGCLCLVRII